MHRLYIIARKEGEFVYKASPQRSCTCFNISAVCDLAMDIGPCDAVFPSWFFNSESGECEMFNYGGCGGNENRFDSLQACQSRCDNDGMFQFATGALV